MHPIRFHRRKVWIEQMLHSSCKNWVNTTNAGFPTWVVNNTTVCTYVESAIARGSTDAFVTILTRSTLKREEILRKKTSNVASWYELNPKMLTTYSYKCQTCKLAVICYVCVLNYVQYMLSIKINDINNFLIDTMKFGASTI